MKIILTALLALPLLTLNTQAGTAEIDASKSAPAPTLAKSAISGDIGVTVLNAYNTRGIIVESKGVIFQPYADLYLRLYQGDGFIQTFSIKAGVWNDFSSSAPLAREKTQDLRHWTEFDWDVGILVKFARRFTFSSVYLQYNSPSDAYRLGKFINSSLSFDDSGIFDDNFSFAPHFTFLYELPGPGQAGLRGHSWYFEPGIAPNYTVLKGSRTPITLAIPLYAGLGSSFYAGRTVGYLAGGVQATVQLGFIPPQYGSWSFSTGYRYYHLGSTTQAVAPDQRETQHLFTGALGLAF